MTAPADFTAILASWEAQQPDAVAITFGGSNRTWAELAHACAAPPRRCGPRGS